MRNWQTCRFCKQTTFETPHRRMFKYGTRHWAHYDCAVDRKGFEALINELPRHWLEAFPIGLLSNEQEQVLQVKVKAFWQQRASGRPGAASKARTSETR